MPSGITHMIVSRKVLDSVVTYKDNDIHALLQDLRGPYILGCISPDLPYMTLMDLNLFSNRKNIADALHYEKTNQIPLLGLRKAREFFKQGNVSEAEALYSFYVGYCSHIIADGIIHPYVRDMVGDYEVAATPHRILEMKLDVLIAEKLLKKNANEINFHEELQWLKDCQSKDIVFDSFAENLKTVYGFSVESSEIKNWTTIMDFIFDMATGRFPLWYQKMLGDMGAALKDFEVLKSEKDEILTLGKPIDAQKHNLTTNYMQKDQVCFFEDVLSKYINYFPKFILKSYEYVFKDGPEPTSLLPEIDLDTGRLLAKKELTNKPAILEITA